MEEQVLTIEFNKETCLWELIDESTPAEDAFKTDPDLRNTLEYIRTHGEFIGTAQELADIIHSTKKPQSISGKLQNKKHQLEKMGILFEKRKQSDGMHLTILDINFKKDPTTFTEDDLPYEIIDDDI